MMPFGMLRQYGLCYLASPYSLFPGGTEIACAEVAKVAGELIAEGVKIFCPIAHSHTICEYSELDRMSHELWLDQDEALMAVCDALVVTTFAGWENSYGIQQERDFFEAHKKPIHFLNPLTMDMR